MRNLSPLLEHASFTPTLFLECSLLVWLATSTHALRFKSWQLLSDFCPCPRENRLLLWTAASLGSPVSRHTISLRTWGMRWPAADSVWPTQKVLHKYVYCTLVAGNTQTAYTCFYVWKFKNSFKVFPTSPLTINVFELYGSPTLNYTIHNWKVIVHNSFAY